MKAKLALENQIALQVIQAALGLVSSPFRAIAFTVEDDVIQLYVLLDRVDSDIESDLEDFQFELDVLTEGRYKIESVLGEMKYEDWPGKDKRLTFCRKEM